MAKPGAWDDRLGRVWLGGDPDTCSKCSATISEEEVPLMLFKNEGRDGMYAYCGKCELTMLRLLMPPKQSIGESNGKIE